MPPTAMLRIQISVLLLLCAGLLLGGAGSRAHAASLWGPVLGNVTSTSAAITWRDGVRPARGVLFNGRLYAGTKDANYRKVTLSGLQPDTAYSYTLVQANRRDEYTFHTAPAVPADFTFVAYGDTRSQPQVHRQVVDAIMGMNPRFIINSGDLVGSGTRTTEWDTLFSVAAPLTGSAPYFVAPGNHEQNSSYFYRLFPGVPGGGAYGHEWYATTYGNVRIIVLNSTRKVAEQALWLDQYLSAHRSEGMWTLVTFHYPPFSSSNRNGDETMRREWVPILEKHQVDAVFLGHDHFYERSERNGVTYIITGGGGAPMYPPNATSNIYQRYAERAYHFVRVDVGPTSLRIRMIRLDGSVGDDVTLTKPARPALPNPFGSAPAMTPAA